MGSAYRAPTHTRQRGLVPMISEELGDENQSALESGERLSAKSSTIPSGFAGTVLSRCIREKFAQALQDLCVHCGGDFAGLRVLLAGVVDAE